MTDIDLDAVEALARNATPGPWAAVHDHHTCYLDDEADCEHSDSPITKRIEWHEGVDGALHDAVHHTHASYDSHWIDPDVAGNYDYEDGGIIHTVDAEYIAAANPSAVLTLIADLRRAQETIDAIEDFVVAHYLDTQMGRRVLALIDPATYDEGKTDE